MQTKAERRDTRNSFVAENPKKWNTKDGVINAKIVRQGAVGSRMVAGLHIVANAHPDLMCPCGGNECQKDWLDYKSKLFPIRFLSY